MPRKLKTLPENFAEIVKNGDIASFKAVFDKCEITATKKGRTTENALSFEGITSGHIDFLVENGIDVNADSGDGCTAAAYQSYSLENLKCLIRHGADIDKAIEKTKGNALFYAAMLFRTSNVKNLLECGAKPDIRGGYFNNTPLDEMLSRCGNFHIPKALEISCLLLDAGAEKTEKTAEYVHKIGEKFEFMRADFNKDHVDEVSIALQGLYKLFEAEPVPRRVVNDGKTPIKVKPGTWQQQYSELWNTLVPGKGNAATVQGEIIRIVGRITHEILDNGAANWDKEHRKMLRALEGYFHLADGMEPGVVDEACRLAKSVSPNSDEEVLYRLTELAVKWVVENPEPIELSEADYKKDKRGEKRIMQPLYEVKMRIEYDDYKRYRNKYTAYKTGIASFIVIVFAMLYMVLERSTHAGPVLSFVLSGGIIAALFAGLLYKTDMDQRKEWDCTDVTMKFYEDSLESDTGNSLTKRTYASYSQLIEDEGMIYLVISKQQVTPLKKQDCPDGLVEFLRERIGKS